MEFNVSNNFSIKFYFRSIGKLFMVKKILDQNYREKSNKYKILKNLLILALVIYLIIALKNQYG